MGQGIGARDANPRERQRHHRRGVPSPLLAFCVPGTPGCVLPVCNDGEDNDGDGPADFPDDPGCVDPMGGSEVAATSTSTRTSTRATADSSSPRSGANAATSRFRGWADFDRDGRITFVDYQRWLAALRAYQASLPPSAPVGCGLLGVELLPVLWLARRRHGRKEAR